MFIITDEIPKSCSYCTYCCGLPIISRPDRSRRHPSCPIRELSLNKGFGVIDKKTGEYPDLEKLALEEDWAKGLCYCDMEGFALSEEGDLILMDECGRFRYCPPDRFEVVLEKTR